ncbi:MAG: hypothetical protein CMH66_14785 [Nioella sp.]|nr:hypothetical protein [Nioella sp.]
MRPYIKITAVISVALALAGCEQSGSADVDRAIGDLNVIDENNLNDIMLSAADPAEAVTYFRSAAAENPDRIDLQRGLATSLIRARMHTEGAAAWARVVASDEVTDQDRVDYADALIRTNDWDGAEEQLDLVPPTFETYERYRLEAMVADSDQEWDRADSFYETAVGLTMQPAGVLNNWGYSMLTRGDHDGAERLFTEALTYDPNLFHAKNNLVLARAARGQYTLPLVQVTQVERAQLLHTMALAAVRRGDIDIGRGLLQDAIDTHPQHFEAAVTALRSLDSQG